uniref:Uncharacterized protein n=1 Tax=Human betaherpesvirus 6A TaxID=32603 RepID=Q69584_9BETA|nr:unnamed protein product [Human betaherpesvirus 6A]
MARGPIFHKVENEFARRQILPVSGQNANRGPAKVKTTQAISTSRGPGVGTFPTVVRIGGDGFCVSLSRERTPHTSHGPRGWPAYRCRRRSLRASGHNRY